MRPVLLSAAVLAALASACAPPPGSAPGTAPAAQSDTSRTLRPFESASELVRFYDALESEPIPPPPPPPPPAPPPAPAPAGPGAPAPVAVEAAPAPAPEPAAAGESVTNVQHAGVDEGGIVKVHGDHLVILRRGRLFTVRIGDGALQPVSAVDAFGPGLDPDGAWYDELLVADDLVAVIGYSYERGGTEVGLFRIDDAGQLRYRATYQLRTNDYYSSRNYASRLVDGKLVFYTPIPTGLGESLTASMPALRRWGAGETGFLPTISATRIYRPAIPLREADQPFLHTVTVCDPEQAKLECTSTALFGPDSRVFYVSPSAVYVWATHARRWDEDDTKTAPPSVLYRMPLDGSAPTGVRVTGGPVDQFSFLESGDGHLNVLVRSDGIPKGMWGAEWTSGSISLLRVPLASFGDGRDAVPADHYRPLPQPADGGPFQNRFVGDWLLYGTGSGWGRPRETASPVYAVRWAGNQPAAALPLPHGIDRIEQMGSGAVVIGSDGRDLHFSGVHLGPAASLADRYTRRAASQGETRSHGFFYRPDGEDTGLLGLPIRGAASPGYEHLVHGSAAILYLRNDDFALRELGELAARAEDADDACRASCVDWYGNARPLFLRGRVFALLGYEIVEGAEDDGRIREVRRIDFAPQPVVAEGR